MQRGANILDILFLAHPVRKTERGVIEPTKIVIFSEEKLMLAVGLLQTKKAPVPDGIPAEVLKTVK